MSHPLAPISDAAWPAQIADMRGGFAGQLNVYRVMAHHPELLRAWTDLRMHVVRNNALGPSRAEVVILRLGHRLGCAYEWNQHVIRALDIGLEKARIASLRGPLEAMAPEDAVLAGAVDKLLAEHKLPERLYTDLQDLVGRAGCIDLMATVGMYLTLGFLLQTSGAPLDTDIAERLQRDAPELMA